MQELKEVHKKAGVGKADRVGEASERQRQSLWTLELVPSLAGYLLMPDEARGLSAPTLLQELDRLHRGGGAAAVALYVKLWSLSPAPLPLLLGWGHKMGSLALGYLTRAGS